MSHTFVPSKKEGVSYCSFCGCVSYNGIVSKYIFPHSRESNLMKMDPLTLRFSPIAFHYDKSSQNRQMYISKRQEGLSIIASLSKKCGLEKKILYKAFGLLDQVYLAINDDEEISPIEKIEDIACVCLLLTVQFHDCFSLKLNNCRELSNLCGLKKFLAYKIKNLMFWEIYCLKKLDYNLSNYTVYDYINLFFKVGFVFTEDNINIQKEYDRCVAMFEYLLNFDDFCCKYSQYTIALSLIYYVFYDNKYFDNIVFHYIYGVNFKRKKYVRCINELNMIFSYGRNITYIPIYNFNYSNVNIVINNSNNYIQLNNQIFIYPEEYSCYSLPKKDEKDNKLRKK